MGYLGIYMFSSLVLNDWRIKRANEEYPVYKDLLLIIINAVVFLIIDHREKSFLFFIIPMIVWLYIIVVSTYHKWKSRF